MAAILSEKKDIEPLAKAGKKRKPAQSAIDKKADIAFLLFSDSFIKALPWPMDPRFLIDPRAFLTAGGNLYIENDQVRLDLTAYHQEGRLLLPNTLDKSGDFTLLRFVNDEQFLAAGVKLETTESLTDPIQSQFSQGNESKLKAKIIKMTMAHLLDAVGPEVGMIVPVFHDKSPAFLFQIKDKQKLEKSLSRLQHQVKEVTGKLSALVGQSVDTLLNQPELFQSIVEKLPEEEQSQAKSWMAQLMDSVKTKGEFQLSGAPIHYEIIGDFLVVSRYAWVLDKVRESYHGSTGASQTREVLGNVDAGGSAFLVVDLLEYAQGAKLIKGTEVVPILKRHSWKSAVSLMGSGSRTKVKASLALNIGTADSKIKPGAGLLALYYGAILLCIGIFLLAAWGLVRSVRKIIAEK
jgi:hypothetical protein